MNTAITLIVKGFHRDLTNNGFRRITQIALIIIREIRLISFNPLSKIKINVSFVDNLRELYVFSFNTNSHI